MIKFPAIKISKELTFSVVISTFNRNDYLLRCLDSLNSQAYSDFEIIIVNGGDYEGVKKVADYFSNLNIRIVNQDQRGLSRARNLGWLSSKSDIVCFIDDDLIVSSPWLENIRDTFLLDDNIGGVSGPTIIPEYRQNSRDLIFFLKEFRNTNNFFLKAIGNFYLKIILENKILAVGKILRSGTFTPGANYMSSTTLPGLVEVDYLEACHMCFQRSLVAEVNGFDYAYTGTGEWAEPDAAFKIRGLGYKLIFNPKAITEHRISQDGVFKARINAYERSKNFIHFYFKWIKPDTLNKAVRFGLNLLFVNLYWIYKFAVSGNTNWLSGIKGTLSGLRQEICRS